MGNRLYYHFKRLFSPAFKDKIKLLFLILKYDWRIAPAEFTLSPLFEGISEEEINKKFEGLDTESVNVGKYFIKRRNIPPSQYLLQLCNRDKYYPHNTKYLEKTISNEILKMTYEMHFPPEYGDVATLYFHNGLRILSENVLDYIRSSVFIDAGAYCGDSAIMFLKYEPHKVISFEPSSANRELYKNIMRLNHIPEEKYFLCDRGLSSEDTTVFFSEKSGGSNSLLTEGNQEVKVVKLDSFLQEYDFGRIGLIKADLEGMGLKALSGAEKTIRKHRPVLALSIYHNQEEFFGIYSTLKQWNLNYKFKVVSLEPVSHEEITLLGVPMEVEGPVIK